MPLDQGTKARSRLEIDASTFTHEGALLVPADALLYFVAESSQPLDFALASDVNPTNDEGDGADASELRGVLGLVLRFVCC